jgi:hypothetical protein
MSKKRSAAKGRQVVAAVVSQPGMPLIPDMLSMTAKCVFFHTWGRFAFPKEFVFFVLVEGSGEAFDGGGFPIMPMTIPDMKTVMGIYQESRKEDSSDGSSLGKSLLITIGSVQFCQESVRYWGAEPEGLCGWGATMLGHLTDAPPATLVWMDGQNGEIHRENILELANKQKP